MVFKEPLKGNLVSRFINFTGIYPQAVLNESKTEEVIRYLANINKIEIPHDILSITPSFIPTSYFIFKCSNLTGGTVFYDNIFGAPAEQYRSVVSKVQKGNNIFLWHIEEHKLYGIWRANGRGQYKPGAFPEAGGKFPAVVYATRVLQHERGIDETSLRRIMPFDGTMPPYIVPIEFGQKIANVFYESEKTEFKPQGNIGEKLLSYKADDGHVVRSQAELIIDNWLFHYQLLHAYDYPLQFGLEGKRCDFYLPLEELYIEFWGLLSETTYAINRKHKLELYKKANLKLLELFPQDLPILTEILKKKFSAFGVNI